MAKSKKPKKPEPTIPSGTITDAINEWLGHGGGKTEGKGRAQVEGNPPNQEPEFVGFEGDQAIFKPGKQPGVPELTPIIPQGESPYGHPGTSGGLGETGDFTAEQIQLLLEDIYGKSGAIRNFDPNKLKSRVGGVSPGPIPIGGNKIQIPGLTLSGSRITTLPPLPTSGSKVAALGKLPTSGTKITTPTRLEELLSMMARNRARANGQHLLR